MIIRQSCCDELVVSRAFLKRRESDVFNGEGCRGIKTARLPGQPRERKERHHPPTPHIRLCIATCNNEVLFLDLPRCHRDRRRGRYDYAAQVVRHHVFANRHPRQRVLQWWHEAI